MSQISFIGDIKDDKKLIETIVSEVLSTFQEKKGSIEMWFATSAEIQKLNREHRHIDRPTDVLSFPQAKDAPSDILGSIVIARDIVDQKNEDLRDVVKHGLLHLLGFDHEENETEWQAAAKKIDCNL